MSAAAAAAAAGGRAGGRATGRDGFKKNSDVLAVSDVFGRFGGIFTFLNVVGYFA